MRAPLSSKSFLILLLSALLASACGPDPDGSGSTDAGADGSPDRGDPDQSGPNEIEYPGGTDHAFLEVDLGDRPDSRPCQETIVISAFGFESTSVATYEYDPQGRLVVREERDDDDTNVERRVFVYADDEAEHPTVLAVLDEDNWIYAQTVYDYDEDGQLQSIERRQEPSFRAGYLVTSRRETVVHDSETSWRREIDIGEELGSSGDGSIFTFDGVTDETLAYEYDPTLMEVAREKSAGAQVDETVLFILRSGLTDRTPLMVDGGPWTLDVAVIEVLRPGQGGLEQRTTYENDSEGRVLVARTLLDDESASMSSEFDYDCE